MEEIQKQPQMRSDWRPVYVALAVHLLSMAYYFGSQNVRIGNVEHTIAVIDARGGFATHDDLKDLTAAQTIQDQQRDMRMNAIDGKVDVIENRGTK